MRSAGSTRLTFDKNGSDLPHGQVPVSFPRRPLSIGLLAVPEVSGAVVYGLHEVFTCVGTVWDSLTGKSTQARRILPRIVGRSTTPLRTTLGASLLADHTFDEEYCPDVVIVGDLHVGVADDAKHNWGSEGQWLRKQYERGALICAVCTGAIMLAEAHLLDGLEATTHWSARRAFEECYPTVALRPERILVPAGDGHRIVTSGGSASWTELALYLVARFCGEDEARRIAKVFLFGDRKDGQLPFASMVRPKQHEDAVIAQSQIWVAYHYAVANPVSKMAELSGLSARTFKRRFVKTTGYNPLDYVQSLRMEEAKQMLETTDDPIDEVGAAVGYEEPNSFRRLFKRTTGITPHQYRVRFRKIGTAYLRPGIDDRGRARQSR